MNRENEVRRLQFGPAKDERAEGIAIVQLISHCLGNSEMVLAKCREVLQVVFQQDPDNWPTDEEWQTLLPSWFIAKCAQELPLEQEEQLLKLWRSLPANEQIRVKEEREWTLSGWIYWFQPDMREWFWWDAMIDDPNTIRVAIEVNGWPFPWGAMKWLLQASGATSVEPEET